MGILGLNNNLKNTLYYTDSKNTPLPIDRKRALKAYYDLCGQEEYIKDCIFHIDTFLLLYRLLFSFYSVEETINFLRNHINAIKDKNNRILFYREPRVNERKKTVHKERAKQRNVARIGIEKQLTIDLKDRKVNSDILLAAGLNSNDKELSFEERLLLLEPEQSLFSSFETEEEKSSEVRDFVLNQPSDMLSIKEKNDLFKLFLYNVGVDKIVGYIISNLLESGTLTSEDIVLTEVYDGELKIVENIKDNYKNQKNIVISKDQDYILFSLLHLDVSHIYIKDSLLVYNFDITIIKNNEITRNISLLTAFLNKSDYFEGIHDLRLTSIRLKNFLKIYTRVLWKKLTLKTLIATYLFWFRNILNSKKRYREIDVNPDLISKVEYYFTDFDNYLKMIKNFYSKQSAIQPIDSCELHTYFKTIGQLIHYSFNEDDMVLTPY